MKVKSRKNTARPSRIRSSHFLNLESQSIQATEADEFRALRRRVADFHCSQRVSHFILRLDEAWTFTIEEPAPVGRVILSRGERSYMGLKWLYSREFERKNQIQPAKETQLYALLIGSMPMSRHAEGDLIIFGVNR